MTWAVAIAFREFLNTDPPLIVEIWRRQRRFRGLTDRLTHEMFDDFVASKPYFESSGLILAFDETQPVGFVQTGFCPVLDGSDIDRQQGVVSQIRVIEREDTAEIAAGLLLRAEQYLKSAGARIVYAGGKFPTSPYYHGLYGGSRIPGVLVDDHLMLHTLREGGYQDAGSVLIFHKRLAGFRPIVDGQQMTARRQFQLQVNTDPPFETWWEACTMGFATRSRFELIDRNGNGVVGGVTFWDIEPLASCWGVRAMGLNDLRVSEEHRRCGLATFLLGESMRNLAQEGISIVEVQAPAEDHVACGVFSKFRFEQVGEGRMLTKELA